MVAQGTFPMTNIAYLLFFRYWQSQLPEWATVNSEIFARFLFSRNFAYAKFHENKILAILRNHSVVYWYM